MMTLHALFKIYFSMYRVINNEGQKVLGHKTNKNVFFEVINKLIDSQNMAHFDIQSTFIKKIGLNFMLKHLEVKFQNTALSRMLASKFLQKLIFPNFCYQIINFLILCKFLLKLWLLVHMISKKSEFLAMKA